MNRWIRRMLFFALLSPAFATPLQAQGVEYSGFFDWIHKLSGPPFIGARLSVGLPGVAVSSSEKSFIRPRLSVMGRTSVSESGDVTPDTANIIMWTFQPAIEFDARIAAIGVGVGAHWFTGDFDTLLQWSFPAFELRIRPFRNMQSYGLLKYFVFGGGVNSFFEFDTDDFAPLMVEVSTDGPEWVWGLFVGFNYF